MFRRELVEGGVAGAWLFGLIAGGGMKRRGRVTSPVSA